MCASSLDWAQEQLLHSWWALAQQGREAAPWLDTPEWINQGGNLIGAIRAAEADEERRKWMEQAERARR